MVRKVLVAFSCFIFSSFISRSLVAEFYEKKADENLRNALWDQAVESYKGALLFLPENAELHAKLGGLYAMRGDVDSAIREYREALKLLPVSGLYHQRLGWLYARQGRDKEASRELLRGILCEPHCAALYRNYAVFSLNRALRRGEKKYIDGAVKSFKRAILLDPSLTPEALQWYEKIVSHTKEPGKQAGWTREEYERLRTMVPDIPEAHFYLAAFLKEKGSVMYAWRELQTAENQWRKKGKQGSLRAQIQLLKFYYEAKSYQRGISLGEYLLAHVPYDYQVNFYLALCYQGRGRTEDAIAAFRRTVVYAPDKIWPYIYLSRNYEKIGDLSSACFWMEKAYAIWPENQSAREGLTAIRRKLKTLENENI